MPIDFLTAEVSHKGPCRGIKNILYCQEDTGPLPLPGTASSGQLPRPQNAGFLRTGNGHQKRFHNSCIEVPHREGRPFRINMYQCGAETISVLHQNKKFRGEYTSTEFLRQARYTLIPCCSGISAFPMQHCAATGATDRPVKTEGAPLSPGS